MKLSFNNAKFSKIVAKFAFLEFHEKYKRLEEIGEGGIWEIP